MGLNSKQATASDLDLSDLLPKLSQGRTNSNNQQQERLKCPRCDSTNTKFCYYNNYNRSQPRHLCKACKRHWTQGGTLRNVPVGGARKKKRRKITTTTANPLPTVAPPDHHSPAQFGAEGKTESFSDILHRMLLNSSSADYSFIGSTVPVQSTMFAPNLGSMVPRSAAVNSRMELGATPCVSSYVYGGGQQVEPTLSPATGSAMTGWAGESSGIGDCWSSWDVNDDIIPPGP